MSYDEQLIQRFQEQQQRYYEMPDPAIEPTRALRKVRNGLLQRMQLWEEEYTQTHSSRAQDILDDLNIILLDINDVIDKEIEATRHPEQRTAYARGLAGR